MTWTLRMLEAMHWEATHRLRILRENPEAQSDRKYVRIQHAIDYLISRMAR